MAKVTDVTRTESNLRASLKRLANSDISDQDKQDIEDFYFSLRRANLNKGTQILYINVLKKTCEVYKELNINKSLREIQLRDFDKLLFALEEKGLKDGTINSYKKACRKFMTWVYGKDVPTWILTELKLKKIATRIRPEDIPSREEFTAFLEAARHPRDKAIIAVAGDAGTRISALLSCTISSFVENEHAAILYLNPLGTNKTTPAKGIPLTWSTAYVQSWLAIHPFREDVSAPLWTTLRKRKEGNDLDYQALSYDSAYQIFKEIEDRLQLKKHTHPHMLRHYAVTGWILDGMSEQIIKHRAGWGPDSQELGRYGNWKEEDLNKQIFELYGLKTQDTRAIELKKCPRCNNILKPEDRFCSRCSLVLDHKAYEEMEEDRGEFEKFYEMFRKKKEEESRR